MSNNKNSRYSQEHAEFQRWVHGLDRSQLLNAMGFAFQEDGHSNNSHEYELLQEMIRQQSPPPTPIHPRVGGGTDGRNEAARVLRNRTKRPRLFQFFERRSACSPPPGNPGGRRRHRERNGASSSSSSAQRKRNNFDVMATAKCVQPWGDAYNVDIPENILKQDKAILSYSVVDPCIEMDQNNRTYLSYYPTEEQSSSATILRMLQVASRGYFLSIPHSRKKKVPLFCAPWLDPTNRWFSLPMYLASRYEVALWESYQDDRRTSALRRDRPWDNLQENLNDEVIWHVIQKSLRDTLLNDVIPSDKAVSSNMIRNALLFELLAAPEFQRLKQLLFFPSEHSALSLSKALKSIVVCPIVELGSSANQVRLYLRQRFQAEIRVQIERQLLNALANGTSTDPGAITDSSAGRSGRKKRSKKKNRKKKPMYRKGDYVTASPNTIHNPMGSTQTGESSDEESDASPSRSLRHSGEMRLSFPDNGTPFVERNKNIVLCLGTLNDIINDVFRKVGLEVSSDESDSSIVEAKPSGDRPAIAKKKLDAAKSSPQQKQLQQQHVSKPPARPSTETIISQHIEAEEKKIFHPSDSDVRYSPQSNEDDPLALGTPPGGSFDDTFPSFPPGFFHRPFGSNPWGNHDSNADTWGRSNRYPARERSILAEFFLEQEVADANRQDRIIASTAASLASSTDKNNEDTISISDKFFISLDNGGTETPASDIDVDDDDLAAQNEISAEEFPSLLDIYQQKEQPISLKTEEVKPEAGNTMTDSSGFQGTNVEKDDMVDKDEKPTSRAGTESRSLSPEAPATPSPRLSPILLSLDDLRDIREGAQSVGKSRKLAEFLPPGVTLTVPASLPNSPVVQSRRRLVTSLSREDLRIDSFRDDQGFARRDKSSLSRSRTYTGGPASYRNVAAKGVKPAAKPAPHDGSLKARGIDARATFLEKYKKPVDSCARSETAADFMEEANLSGGALSYRNVVVKSAKSVSDGSWNAKRLSSERVALPMKQDREADICARSETAVEGHEDYPNWHDSSRRTNEDNADNITVGKDGSTTITSAMSHRGESEETSNLREERNTFRDMVLTLGAEVAKLKNQLATQNGSTMYPAIDYAQGYVQPVFGAGSFDPECMPPFFQKGQALGAMSDAGIHRAEYESQISEDEEARVSKGDPGRRMSSGNTAAGSDISVEYTSSSLALHVPAGLPAPFNRDAHDPMSGSGLQTRLSQDIMRFLAATEIQHRKLDKTRDAAVGRMTRLVNTLWPRAQVKLYGSHVTSLCLPSSDLDFVICLPAVHKNAPAVAPGVLEGRNAINESSQKLLARKLKGESWIDPRSMKLIERTVVPVIKVATKDTRARTMQLDISFDSPEHHGLEAIVMVKQIVEELPMIRPLVLVLKQFLLDRGLLTAYTGGLSSYCLFLMVARYLQEQSSWGDCGSLLMGFLDFYGNCFDPRSTGISVGRRQYFTRANYVAAQSQAAGQHMWTPIPPSPGPVVMASPASAGGHPEFFRRNSFSDKGSVDSLRGGGSGTPPLSRPPRFQPPVSSRFMMHVAQPAAHVPYEQPMDHAMPFTFDPLFVDDPLSSGNNVGRNAFRIFQVQRAFSDAHRALVASLEWDIQSAGDLHDGNDYPLLKCLLQSEDVLYEL